ncbi:MAG TPA: hypothetical protein VG895_04230 [Patescibacteria group bacterium]|nr:hypothetical protein [Patescibacteria group bacterium]
MKAKKPGILITAILTLITVIFWTGFEVYHSLTTKPVPPVPQAIINPLDPTLDTKSLDAIQARNYLTDDQIGNTEAVSETGTPIPSLTPSPTPISVSTPSASVTPSPSATP